jgi:hypothetical protein
VLFLRGIPVRGSKRETQHDHVSGIRFEDPCYKPNISVISSCGETRGAKGRGCRCRNLGKKRLDLKSGIPSHGAFQERDLEEKVDPRSDSPVGELFHWETNLKSSPE